MIEREQFGAFCQSTAAMPHRRCTALLTFTQFTPVSPVFPILAESALLSAVPEYL